MDDSGSLKYTLEGEEIEDSTIVEFKYDSTKENYYKWIPLRVRYDKLLNLDRELKILVTHMYYKFNMAVYS